MIFELNSSLCSSLNREILVSGHEGSCKVFSTEDVLVNNGLFGSILTCLLDNEVIEYFWRISTITTCHNNISFSRKSELFAFCVYRIAVSCKREDGVRTSGESNCCTSITIYGSHHFVLSGRQLNDDTAALTCICTSTIRRTNIRISACHSIQARNILSFFTENDISNICNGCVCNGLDCIILCGCKILTPPWITGLSSRLIELPIQGNILRIGETCFFTFNYIETF